MAVIIDGKAVAQRKKEEVRAEVEAFVAETGIQPTLAVILVGDDPASAVYVRNKGKACAECGIRSLESRLPATATEAEILGEIDRLNGDPTVHGILVQLPLPDGICEEKILLRIRPEKDVDAFHPYNVGRLVAGKPEFLPCTPAGVMELLRAYDVETKGKNCVIVGRSNIVGKPMFHLMLSADATVTVCHSKTVGMAEITKQADILIVAVGKAGVIRGDMIKPGATVIDVGINRNADGKLCGDVAFDEAEEVAGKITPVPGGVGPMTVAMLMQNTLTAAKSAK